jgi:RND family efflux transporter MFP subunit
MQEEQDRAATAPESKNADTSSRGPLPDRDKGPGGSRSKDADVNRRRWRSFCIILALAVLGLAAVLGYGVYSRNERNQAAQNELDGRKERVPELRIEKVKAVDSPREFHLPATTQAFDSATIFARQSGYIAQRLVDIGSRVSSGDLLAVISAPEVDDQLTQARAQLKQMQAALEQNEANRSLAAATSKRFTPLVQQGWETKQTGDQYRYGLEAQNAAVDVAKSNIQAQQAQIARLERQQSYERVVAPFNGVITQRNIDVGSLVTADVTSGTPLFAISHDNVLRVQVRVPQEVALQLKPGMDATLDIPEIPGRSFGGKVARTANALDPLSRTLLVEADIANPGGTLTSGLYGTVHFLIPRRAPVIMVPASALIFDQHGLRVAVYADGKAHLHKVGIGEDDGAIVQIATGLEPGQEIIVAPPAGLADGARVTPFVPKRETSNKAP